MHCIETRACALLLPMAAVGGSGSVAVATSWLSLADVRGANGGTARFSFRWPTSVCRSMILTKSPNIITAGVV